MAMRAADVRNWIAGIPPSWTVYIGEDGLTLYATGPSGQVKPYIEIGGEPGDNNE